MLNPYSNVNNDDLNTILMHYSRHTQRSSVKISKSEYIKLALRITAHWKLIIWDFAISIYTNAYSTDQHRLLSIFFRDFSASLWRLWCLSLKNTRQQCFKTLYVKCAIRITCWWFLKATLFKLGWCIVGKTGEYKRQWHLTYLMFFSQA